MTRIGIALIIISILFMLASLLLPDTLAPLSPLFCEDGETLGGQVIASGNLRRSTVGTSYWCTDKNGNQRNVNDSVIAGTTIIFLALFFVGMGVASVGYSISQKGKAAVPTSTPSPAFTLENRIDASTGLTDALKDLEDSRAAGLISEDEYQRLRQKVMERFG